MLINKKIGLSRTGIRSIAEGNKDKSAFFLLFAILSIESLAAMLDVLFIQHIENLFANLFGKDDFGVGKDFQMMRDRRLGKFDLLGDV